MPLVPITIPANFITIFSNLFVYTSLGLAIVYPEHPSWIFPCISLMLLIYVVGDHLDGMQAKKTGTSSPLGEFCDHFLDAFNNGLMLILLMLLFDIQDKNLMIYLLVTSYLAHAAIFYHQYKTGWLVFEKFGSLEAMILTIVLLAGNFFPAVHGFFTMEFFGYKIIEGVLLTSSLGALGTFVKSIRDAGGISTNFLVFIFLLVLMAVALSLSSNPVLVYALLTVYASSYIGTLMHGHLVSRKEPRPDFWSIGIMAIIILYSLQANLLWFFLWFLIFRLAYLTYLTFYPLRSHWLWSNPVAD